MEFIDSQLQIAARLTHSLYVPCWLARNKPFPVIPVWVCVTFWVRESTSPDSTLYIRALSQYSIQPFHSTIPDSLWLRCKGTLRGGTDKQCMKLLGPPLQSFNYHIHTWAYLVHYTSWACSAILLKVSAIAGLEYELKQWNGLQNRLWNLKKI